MKTQLDKYNFMWGILLIVFGIAAFLETFIDLTAWGWATLLFVAGIFTFGVFWNQRSNFAYLIPTYVLWSIAGLIFLVAIKFLRDEAIAAYVLTAIAAPFLIAYLRNRTRWGLLIPAYVLMAVGIMVYLIGLRILDDLLIPAYVMFAIALPFFVVYFRNPKNWWSLIPGGILGVIGIAFTLASPGTRFLVPLVLVLLGIWIVLRQYLPGRK